MRTAANRLAKADQYRRRPASAIAGCLWSVGPPPLTH